MVLDWVETDEGDGSVVSANRYSETQYHIHPFIHLDDNRMYWEIAVEGTDARFNADVAAFGSLAEAKEWCNRQVRYSIKSREKTKDASPHHPHHTPS